MSNQLYNILEALVSKNRIRVNQDELKLQISSHPSFPSLHALTGVLQHFNIPNLAIKLPTEKTVLSQLPNCFIAHLNDESQKGLVLVEKQKNSIKVTFDRNETERLSQEVFLKKWDGIIVAIEKGEQIKEYNSSLLTKTWRWLLIIAAISSIVYFVFQLPTFFAKSHMLLSILGLFLSTLILRHELGLESTVVHSFCNLSNKTSCNAVLNSKGAILFQRFKLSDISILTFSIYLVFWFLIFENNVSDYFLIAIATLFAIPITIYSLYYQYKIVRKWCPLCLGIILVLWLQTTALVWLGPSWILGIKNWNTLWLFLLSILVVGSVWRFFKPLIERKIALEQIEVEHYKLKRNFSVFNSLLQQETNLNKPNIHIPGEIVLGNKESILEIILVTSSLCSFCKQAHQDIEHLLQTTQNKVKIIIRFITGIEYKDQLAYQITTQLLWFYHNQEKSVCRQALKEVFSEKIDLQEWLNQQQHSIDTNYDLILQQQRAWCLENEINFTPAFYVNGKQFPKAYDRKDLTYFIDELIEQQEQYFSQNSKPLGAA